MGLLKPADRLWLLKNVVMLYARNRRFMRANPDFALPPADLAFDAYGTIDRRAYKEIGLRHAQLYSDIIRQSTSGKSLAVLEWGCGPARIVRHIQTCLSDYTIELIACDCNPRTIAWNRQHIKDVKFFVNEFMPPLAFPDASFDVVYNFSVFTHLSETAQKAWAKELWSVLRPGGLLICSTQGDYYCNKLARNEEAVRYRRGEVVVQERYPEGKKWFLALHPPRYVKEDLLQQFSNVRKVPVPEDACMRQDLWAACKPARNPQPATPALISSSEPS